MDLQDDFVKKMIEELVPIHKFLGLKLLHIEKDFVKVKVPFRAEVVGDIRSNRWHGGIITTVMDSVGGIVGGTHLSTIKDKMATIDIRVDFLSPAYAKSIIVEGRTLRLGSRIFVANMKCYLENDPEQLPIAEGRAVYNFIRLNQKH
ncbi:hotdog fold thioesterase [Psychroflexus montanilacus]|uniref:hotdog fold thioesterase n=1 Tax=Psychroflexus montanilacus TaxID=2873598 RepID=UPI001CCCA415|nr:hotdog fold thioesterase [Psychroflexus montanilacus]MBZ9653024.1 hotdog fold thioesterase [Psychroflexus montanilacus]